MTTIDQTVRRPLAIQHRVVLWVLASGAAFVGFWAQFAPASFYTDFPGLRRFWVSVDGPYNEHLIRDVGGLNLTLAVLSVTAALVGTAWLARLAAVCWLVSSIPHLAYHASHLEPYGPFDAVMVVVLIGIQVIGPLWLLLTTWQRRP